MTKLKTVEEVAVEWGENGYAEPMLREDRSNILAVLKNTIKEKQDEFYSEREWPASVNMNDGYDLACEDILTLLQETLGEGKEINSIFKE